MERVMSAAGLLAMVGFAWLLSEHKRRVRWRVVGVGLLLQFAFAFLLLRTDPGLRFFQLLGSFFDAALGYVNEGSAFVFAVNEVPEVPRLALLQSFAFGVLPTIVFFSSLMSILYYLRIVQPVVAGLAWLMQYTLGTSGAESLSAAANIFVGQTEAPLVIRPYVGAMTRSELMAVMVGGFATIAGGVMAAYVQMGMDAGHLLTASVISAPAALLIAKVMQPEVDEPRTLGRVKMAVEESHRNVIEAAATGASDGMRLAWNVGAMLIAFVALIAMADGVLQWLGNTLGANFQQEWNWSLTGALSYVFYPFAWLMGVPRDECFQAGQLLGEKVVLTEFVAFKNLGDWTAAESEVVISARTKLIMTYALCGFANFASIGIQIGGIGGIAPERRGDLASLGLRAMIGGSLAAFMTACIAGMLI